MPANQFDAVLVTVAGPLSITAKQEKWPPVSLHNPN